MEKAASHSYAISEDQETQDSGSKVTVESSSLCNGEGVGGWLIGKGTCHTESECLSRWLRQRQISLRNLLEYVWSGVLGV